MTDLFAVWLLLLATMGSSALAEMPVPQRGQIEMFGGSSCS